MLGNAKTYCKVLAKPSTLVSRWRVSFQSRHAEIVWYIIINITFDEVEMVDSPQPQVCGPGPQEALHGEAGGEADLLQPGDVLLVLPPLADSLRLLVRVEETQEVIFSPQTNVLMPVIHLSLFHSIRFVSLSLSRLKHDYQLS